MIGQRFSSYRPDAGKSLFEQLLELFRELLIYTSGDVEEALSWLTQLDQQHGLSRNDYGIGNFIDDLKEQGYLREDPIDASLSITAKTEMSIRKQSLEKVFGKLKKTTRGDHKTRQSGKGDENSGDLRSYEFGDNPSNLALTESFQNAHIRSGYNEFQLQEDDLVVREQEHKAQTSTVLMIDISHSMILYGEDRITPAKKVAMALAELIKTRYPKDTLDIIVFGNDAWQIRIEDLPYLQVGPYHTNTVAGLELAMDLLRKKKNPNRQIFMITDGKPTCLKEGNRYYKNSFGLDKKIVNKTLNLAAACKRLKISITTFMIARDEWLREFVREFTEANGGKAFYSSLQGLGEFIFEDYERNRKSKLR